MAGLFYLFANCNFVPGGYGIWQAAYDELAPYVEAKEPNTLTYYFGIPLDYADNHSGTPSMLAFEVYSKREDLYETHFKSTKMAEFLQKIPPTMPTGLDLSHYSFISGYLDKPADKRECGIMQDVRIICFSSTARDKVKTKIADLCKSIEATEEKEHNGVYTWMAFSSFDDEKEIRLFTRYESREAMEKCQKRKDVLDFWFSTKEEVDKMGAQRFAPQGKGWLYR
ncbi:hypothetical protein EJ08DRAFT_247451 [Tothia fuscella]|uniref:ABM domain-containing protein n=1 Tax=Tothia fuscella TaxID=1048955 RepID=A0A9P4NQL1_9PEZI|nr:hypothetical protein EJ08DRAFT_247451 [Tothia fuscella]